MKKLSVILPITKKDCQEISHIPDCVTDQLIEDVEIIYSSYKAIPAGEILECSADSFVIAEAEGETLSDCLNAGIKKAEGKYICFVRPGDTVSLEMYEKLFRDAEDEELDFISCTNEGNALCGILLTQKDMPQLAYPGIDCFHSLFRKSFIEENNIAFNKIPGGWLAEKSFFWKILANGKKARLVVDQSCVNKTEDDEKLINADDIYEINRTYDYIKAFLIDNEEAEVWERFKGYYCKSKLYDYSRALEQMTGEVQICFWDRFCKEMQRSSYLREIDYDILSEREIGQISMILKYPSGYSALEEKCTMLNNTIVRLNDRISKLNQTEKELQAIIQSLNAQIDILNTQIDVLEGSTSYKVGRAITVLPRKIKDKTKGKKE